MKNALYVIVMTLFGAWMIWMLSKSPELSDTKSKMINRTLTINKMIDKLNERN